MVRGQGGGRGVLCELSEVARGALATLILGG